MNSRNTPQLWQSNLPQWDCEKNNVLICCQIRQETHDVKSFFFTPQEASVFKFLPGQFITLELTIDGEIINRSYTISSSPNRPHVISITVKLKPNGVVSNWLHDNMKVGMPISALGPSGDFTCVLHPAQKYLFLSGGSGVTPLMSMARSFHELAEDADIIFLHSARSPADIIFKHELDLIAFDQPHFQPVYICAKVDKSPNWRLQPEFISEGMLTAENLKLSAPDFLEREVFTCGPAPYMASVRHLLETAGFNMAHYHEESFSFDALATEIQSTVQSEEHTNNKVAQTFSIELSKSGTTIECAPDQFVLDAARAAGLRLPSSCSKGLCGTCKSKLISGQVDMKHGGGIRQREIDQGMFLPCCSKPLSNLVIEK
jgi:ferredoxin-NADP reductase